MNINIQSSVFDYRTLRLMMGLIALFLPVIVTCCSSRELTSISASYYTEARDWLVGLLFVVGALLWAYNGHQIEEAILSKVASVAAVCIAIFPTSNGQSGISVVSSIHYIAAVVLFAILIWFCFFPFQKSKSESSVKKARRRRIYLLCGWVMVACMLSVPLAMQILTEEVLETVSIVFWAETIALLAFGIAWFVAGKLIGYLVDPEDRLKLFG